MVPERIKTSMITGTNGYNSDGIPTKEGVFHGHAVNLQSPPVVGSLVPPGEELEDGFEDASRPSEDRLPQQAPPNVLIK